MEETKVLDKVEYEEYESIPVSFRKFGFWVFLSGEIVILGGIVASGILFRLSYPEWFANSEHTNVIIAFINTLVLLTGSLTAVLAHKYATFHDWGRFSFSWGLQLWLDSHL